MKKQPRIIVLISWFEESPRWLAATLASVTSFADHVVAVDGAYALFPDARARSGSEQAETIQQVCSGAGIGCTIHSPDDVWYGNEVEKRSFLFRAGELVSDPHDWYFVIDGDTVVTTAPEDLKQRFATADEDAAASRLWERDDPHATEEKSRISRLYAAPNIYRGGVRMMFRALRGLTVEQAHYVYSAPCDQCTGEGCAKCMPPVVARAQTNSKQDLIPGTPGKLWLWGSTSTHRLQPYLDLQDVLELEHRNRYRDVQRAQDSHSYYARRNEHAIEKIIEAPEIAAD